MTQPPTILHVFPTFAVGGAQRRLAQLANARPDAFAHSILALDGRTDARVLIGPEAHVSFMEPVDSRGSLLALFIRFRRKLRDWKPDLLITYNWGAIDWALAKHGMGIPHIHIEDGFGPEEVDRQLPRRVLFRRLVLARSGAIVVPSRTLEAIARNVWKLPASKITYIANGIDVAKFKTPQAGLIDLRADLGIARDIPIIGWTGALRREKNLIRLLRAFAAVKSDAALVLAGEGPERANIDKEASDLGIAERVHMLGLRNDVDRLLGQFDIFALSSDTEQMPISVLEAMAAGLPIVSTNVGDIRATVASENQGLIVDCDAHELGRALGRLVASAQLRRDIGAANQAHVAKHFRARDMIETYVTLFQSVAGTRDGPRENGGTGRLAWQGHDSDEQTNWRDPVPRSGRIGLHDEGRAG